MPPARLRNRADHVERALRPVIAGAVEDVTAASQGLLQRHGPARLARECFGDGKRLRQEPLQAPRPADDQPVPRAQFLDTERVSRVAALELQMKAIRQIVRYLRPERRGAGEGSP